MDEAMKEDPLDLSTEKQKEHSSSVDAHNNQAFGEAEGQQFIEENMLEVIISEGSESEDPIAEKNPDFEDTPSINLSQDIEDIRIFETPAQQISKRGTARKRRDKRDKKDLEEAKRQKAQKLANAHKVRECCEAEKCKAKCATKIPPERREEINAHFWSLSWFEQRKFILNNCTSIAVKRHTVERQVARRGNTFKYSFKNSAGTIQNVCKVFFLTTLGYKKTNDRVVNAVLSQTPPGRLQPKPDCRGKRAPGNKISTIEFKEHVESFGPTVSQSQCRREHTPNVRYLPSAITVKSMHIDFKQKYPHVEMSYETYRQHLKKMNISFEKLRHEEC